MKTIGDKPGNFRDALIGWMLATPSGELTAVSGGVNKNKKENKEGIATGGGAGYKPLFLGYVREGMLDGCSVGVLLRSPGSFQILELTKSKYLRAGVLYIYGLLLILLGIVILPISAAAQEKMRIIIDTDAMAEVDDQHAIAYSLFSGDHFEVEGITVNRGSDYPERTERRPYLGTVTIDDHFREAVNVARMCASPDVPVLKGPAGNYRQIKGDINNSTFDGSDAVNFIIEQAHAPSDRPLYIYAMGNLTNVALALLKDPTIAAKIEIWWLGTEWPQNYACNNHAGDLDAVDALLANPQNVAFNIIPWPHKGVTFAEIKDRMTGRGPQVSPAVPGLRGEGPDFASFGDYSVHLFDKFVGSRQKENGRSLLDMIGLAAVKNNVGEFTPYEMGAPSFAVEEESQTGSQAHRYPGTWVENADNPRRVTMWRHPNRDAVYNDFFNTMDNYVLAGSTSPAQEVSQIHHREHNLLLDAKISGNMHTVANAGTYDVILTLSGAGQTAEILERVNIHPAIEAQITPLSGSVLQGNPVTFDASNSYGSIGTYHWDFGDGGTATGKQVTKKSSKAGIYRVTLTVSNSTGNNSCSALVRVHTPETLHLPQVLFDKKQVDKGEANSGFRRAYFMVSLPPVRKWTTYHYPLKLDDKAKTFFVLS